MATSSLEVSDWLSRPAPFNNKKHGLRAKFSGDKTAVERLEPDYYDCGDCVVYTRDPLPTGQVWQITVLNTTKEWKGGGLVSGCVLYLL